MRHFIIALALCVGACSDEPLTRRDVCEIWATPACEDCDTNREGCEAGWRACCGGEATCALETTLSDEQIDECRAALEDATCTPNVIAECPIGK